MGEREGWGERGMERERERGMEEGEGAREREREGERERERERRDAAKLPDHLFPLAPLAPLCSPPLRSAPRRSVLLCSFWVTDIVGSISLPLSFLSPSLLPLSLFPLSL